MCDSGENNNNGVKFEKDGQEKHMFLKWMGIRGGQRQRGKR
jgi:hypothetical protein